MTCARWPPSGDGLTRPREKGIHNARAVFTLYALQGICTLVFSRLVNDDFKYVASCQVKQVGMLVGIEGGSPLFDKHGENSRARASRNLTRAQIRIQLEKGRGRTNANACRTGKDPSSIRSIEAGKMGAPYNDPRLLSEHAIKINPLSRYLRRAESVCRLCWNLSANFKDREFGEKKNWKGMFVLWKKLRGDLLFWILLWIVTLCYVRLLCTYNYRVIISSPSFSSLIRYHDSVIK